MVDFVRPNSLGSEKEYVLYDSFASLPRFHLAITADHRSRISYSASSQRRNKDTPEMEEENKQRARLDRVFLSCSGADSRIAFTTRSTTANARTVPRLMSNSWCVAPATSITIFSCYYHVLVLLFLFLIFFFVGFLLSLPLLGFRFLLRFYFCLFRFSIQLLVSFHFLLVRLLLPARNKRNPTFPAFSGQRLTACASHLYLSCAD